MSFQKKKLDIADKLFCVYVYLSKSLPCLCALNTNSFWIVYACLSESDRSSYSVYICITRNLFLFISGYFNMIWLNYLGIRDLNLFYVSFYKMETQRPFLTKHFTIALAQQWSLEVTYRMHVWFNNPLNEASDICNIFSTRNEFSVQSVRLST